MINLCILMGRLCADPEFRQTTSGIAVCRFRIAVNRPRKKDEEQQADFINVTCWRQTAEFVSRYFSKGKMIIVEGSLRNNDFTDNNGVKHHSLEVLANNVQFGESKTANASDAAQNSSNSAFGSVPVSGAAFQQKAQESPSRPSQDVLGNLDEFTEILSDGELPFV